MMKRNCNYQTIRTYKSIALLWIFLFGHILPSTLYAAPSVQTEITALNPNVGTQIQQNGNIYDVTTTKTYGVSGINHFDKYNVGSIDTVNMHIPQGKDALVNFIHGGRSDIYGIVNSIKEGKIGGNIYFANSDGIVVSNSGVINAGAIHLSTPTRQFIQDALNNPGGHLELLQQNNFPISATGLIQVEGKLNALSKVSLSGGNLVVSGAELNAGHEAQEDIKLNYGDIVNVENLNTAQSVTVDANGVVELVALDSVEVNNQSTIMANSDKDGGLVTIESRGDIEIKDSIVQVNAKENGKAGAIQVKAESNINLDAGAVLSASGSGYNSNGGDIIVFADKETYFEEGAKLVVDAGTSGDAGFGEVSAIQSVFLNGGIFSGQANNGQAGRFLIDPENLTITENIIQTDGSSIELEASNAITVEDSLLFSALLKESDKLTFESLLSTGTVAQIESFIDDLLVKGGSYELDNYNQGGILIVAPEINLRNAQLVSGGSIEVLATLAAYDQYIEAFSNASPDLKAVSNLEELTESNKFFINVEGISIRGASVKLEADRELSMIGNSLLEASNGDATFNYYRNIVKDDGALNSSLGIGENNNIDITALSISLEDATIKAHSFVNIASGVNSVEELIKISEEDYFSFDIVNLTTLQKNLLSGISYGTSITNSNLNAGDSVAITSRINDTYNFIASPASFQIGLDSSGGSSSSSASNEFASRINVVNSDIVAQREVNIASSVTIKSVILQDVVSQVNISSTQITTGQQFIPPYVAENTYAPGITAAEITTAISNKDLATLVSEYKVKDQVSINSDILYGYNVVSLGFELPSFTDAVDVVFSGLEMSVPALDFSKNYLNTIELNEGVKIDTGTLKVQASSLINDSSFKDFSLLSLLPFGFDYLDTTVNNNVFVDQGVSLDVRERALIQSYLDYEADVNINTGILPVGLGIVKTNLHSDVTFAKPDSEVNKTTITADEVNVYAVLEGDQKLNVAATINSPAFIPLGVGVGFNSANTNVSVTIPDNIIITADKVAIESLSTFDTRSNVSVGTLTSLDKLKSALNNPALYLISAALKNQLSGLAGTGSSLANVAKIYGSFSKVNYDADINTSFNGVITGASDVSIGSKLGVADKDEDLFSGPFLNSDFSENYLRDIDVVNYVSNTVTVVDTVQTLAASVAIQITDRNDNVQTLIGDAAKIEMKNDGIVDIHSTIDNSNRLYDLLRGLFNTGLDDIVGFDDESKAKLQTQLDGEFSGATDIRDISGTSSFEDFLSGYYAAFEGSPYLDRLSDLLSGGTNTYVSNQAIVTAKNVVNLAYSDIDYDSYATIQIAQGAQIIGIDNANQASQILLDSKITNEQQNIVAPKLTSVFGVLKNLVASALPAKVGIGAAILNEDYNLNSSVQFVASVGATNDTLVKAKDVNIVSTTDSNLVSFSMKGNSGGGPSLDGSVVNVDYNTNTNANKTLIGENVLFELGNKIDILALDNLDNITIAGGVKLGSDPVGGGFGVAVVDTNRKVESIFKGEIDFSSTNGSNSILKNAQLSGESFALGAAVGVAKPSTYLPPYGVSAAASMSILKTENTISSVFSGSFDTTGEAVNRLAIKAFDNSENVQSAGALNIATGVTGGIASVGAAGNYINLNNTILAQVEGVNSSSFDLGNITVESADYSTLEMYSIAGSGALTILGSSAALAASVNTLINNTQITSEIKGSAIKAKEITVAAMDSATSGGNKETLMITGGIALGGGLGLGASVATYNANKVIRSGLTHSILESTTSVDVNAAKNESVESYVVAGGVGGVVGIAGAVSVYNAGSSVVSQIDNTSITSPLLNLNSNNSGSILVVNVAAGVGGTAGLAGSVVVNNLKDATQALVTGVGVLAISNKANIKAQLDQETDLNVAAAGVGGSVGVAGTVVVNTVNNSTLAKIESAYIINNSGDLNLIANSNYTRKGFAGAIAGGTVGLGAVVTVDNIQNTTESLLAAVTVDISGKVDVQANAYNDYNLLALNISGGKVAIGATVNIVNFGGSISNSTGQLNGDNSNEYNTVVAEYNIAASRGSTSSTIDSAIINAASINLVAKQDNDLTLNSGGLSIGGAAIGVGIGIVDVESEVKSQIGNSGTYNLTGGSGLNISSLVDTDADISSYAGSVGVAAFNLRISDYSSTANAIAGIGNNTSVELNNIGSATVKAEVVESSNVSNLSAQIGGIAASGAYVATTHEANATVNINSGAKVLNATTANINSKVRFTDLDAKAVGLSAGIVAAAALVARVNIEDSKASINTGVGSQVSGGSVNMNSDLITQGINAHVLAVNVGAAAIGVSDAAVSINSSTGSAINLGGEVNASNSLVINSSYNNQQDINVSAQGASGGVVGVSAALAKIDNKGTSSVTVTSNADLSGSNLAITSEASLRQKATAEVLAGGAVGVGVVQSTINSHAQSDVNLAGKIAGSNVNISSNTSDRSVIDNSSGAGGIAAGSNGGVYNTNQLDARITGTGILTLDTDSLAILAQTNSSFDTRLNMQNYGLIAGAAGKVDNKVTQNSIVNLAAGIQYLKENATNNSATSITAVNNTLKADGVSYENILAGLGGYSTGTSNTTHTSNANIIMGVFDDADLIDLSLNANNSTTLNDTVTFDSYLLAGGSDSRSSINSTNNTKIEFQAGEVHVDSLAVGARSNVDISSEVRAVVSGLIAVDVTSYNSAISQGSDQVLFNNGAFVLSDKEAAISAGIGGSVDIDNKSYSYNKSLLPVIPDADISSSGSRNGSINMKAGSQLRAGGDITLSATENDLNVNGYAYGHSITLDILNDVLQDTAGWLLDKLGLPSSVKYEDETRRAIVNDEASINIDGKIQSGLYNYYYLGLDAGSTFDLVTNADGKFDVSNEYYETLEVPDGVDLEYFKALDYGSLDTTFSASGTARESLIALQLIIAAFDTRGFGNDEGTGRYQETYTALIQQEAFLENIVNNGLSDTEFLQVEIAPLEITNGNISINAPSIAGTEGEIRVLNDVRVVIDNRSEIATRVGNIDVNMFDGGKVIVNGVTVSDSYNGIDVDNFSVADTHNGASAGINIFGNTQEGDIPPTLLEGRLSYRGGDISIVNEKGSIIALPTFSIEATNVRMAAGKDIVLGLGDQALIAPYNIDNGQIDAINSALGGTTGTAGFLTESPSLITDAKLNALLAKYNENLAGDTTNGITKLNNINDVKQLLSLMVDPTSQDTIDGYGDYLNANILRVNNVLTDIGELKDDLQDITTLTTLSEGQKTTLVTALGGITDLAAADKTDVETYINTGDILTLGNQLTDINDGIAAINADTVLTEAEKTDQITLLEAKYEAFELVFEELTHVDVSNQWSGIRDQYEGAVNLTSFVSSAVNAGEDDNAPSNDLDPYIRGVVTDVQAIDDLTSFLASFSAEATTVEYVDGVETKSKILGYTYSLKADAGIGGSLASEEISKTTEKVISEADKSVLVAFNDNYSHFTDAVKEVFGISVDTEVQTNSSEQLIEYAQTFTENNVLVAGENIFMSASAVNLNGNLQAGFDTREIYIDDSILNTLKTQYTDANGVPTGEYQVLTTGIDLDLGDLAYIENANGDILPVFDGGGNLVYEREAEDKLVYSGLVLRDSDGVVDQEAGFVIDGVDITWNEELQKIEIDDVEIKGGNITIAGQLYNTGEGNINVMSGYGNVSIVNDTDADLFVGDIQNQYVSGKVTLIDASETLVSAVETQAILNDGDISNDDSAYYNTPQFKKTEYYRELNEGGEIQLVKDVYSKTGSDGEFVFLADESTVKTQDTRSDIFTPRENLVYTYQRLNLDSEDLDRFLDETTVTITVPESFGGDPVRTVSVAYDFQPVLSVDANIYNDIPDSTDTEFGVITYNAQGNIDVAVGNGTTLNQYNNYLYSTKITQWEVYGDGTVLVNPYTFEYPSGALYGQNQTDVSNSNFVSTPENNYSELKNYISGVDLTNVISTGYTNYGSYGAITHVEVVHYRSHHKYSDTSYKTDVQTYQKLSAGQAILEYNHTEAAVRASNDVNINFTGYDRGNVSIDSGGAISIGNISNVEGDTVINSATGSITQRENSTIHSDDITITTGNGSIGTQADFLNIYQDNNDHQLLNISATENLFVKSENGALEFDSLANGANSELALIAEGDLRIKGHTEANQLIALNIHLESKSGELFEGENIYIDTDAENGGVIRALSNSGDIKLVETAGDLAVEKIKANGNVEITVRDGGLIDAQDIEEADEDTIAELLALWDELGIEKGTAQAQARIDSQYKQIQESKESQYQEHWELRRQEETVYAAALDQNYQYTLTSDEQAFFTGQDQELIDNYIESKQTEYETGYSLRGDAYDFNFVGVDNDQTEAYHFYWNLEDNVSVQHSFATYDENYVYELSDTEEVFYANDSQGREDLITLKTQYYIDGAELLGDNRTAAVYVENYSYEDNALKQDIEDKMTWSKDELSSAALNFAYKETTDTVLEVEEANIFAGGNVTINADYVGVKEAEIVLVQTDNAGNTTINELHKQTIVQDEAGNDVAIKQASELAKLALLSAERNDIIIDNGQDGDNAKLSVLQREDFDIDALGEVSINTTANVDDAAEHVYLGSEQNITIKQIASAGDVILKSTKNIIAAINQSDSHVLYGDILVLESADGYIGGETTATGEYLKVQTNNTSITNTDKVGLSARADGSILIQNQEVEQDLWIRDIFSRNGTVAIDAHGSILDRDIFDYEGASDSINIGANRIELTSHNGTIGDASTYGKIELNDETVLVAQAQAGVYIDGEDELFAEEISSNQGDVIIISAGSVSFNSITTNNGNIDINAQTIMTRNTNPVDHTLSYNEAQITTSMSNTVRLNAQSEDEEGASIDLSLAAQQGVFNVTAPKGIKLNSQSANLLDINNIIADSGSLEVSNAGNIDINLVGTPHELKIETTAGDANINTIGGGISVVINTEPYEALTPEKVIIKGLVQGSQINVNNLYVEKAVDLQGDFIKVQELISQNNTITLNVIGNDEGRANSLELNALNNTATVFNQLASDDFELTTDNNSLIILKGDVGNIGTIETNRYLTQVSAFFQPISIYDYQIYTADNKFNALLSGANTYSSNYASYVDPDYLYNGQYSIEESALSLVERLNAIIDNSLDLDTIERNFEVPFIEKSSQEQEELFQSHIISTL